MKFFEIRESLFEMSSSKRKREELIFEEFSSKM
jgi:hypothetical protein